MGALCLSVNADTERLGRIDPIRGTTLASLPGMFILSTILVGTLGFIYLRRRQARRKSQQPAA
jgi:hypothetical protein